MRASPQVRRTRRLRSSLRFLPLSLALSALVLLLVAPTSVAAQNNPQGPSCIGYPIGNGTALGGVMRADGTTIGGAFGYAGNGVVEMTWASASQIFGLRWFGADVFGDGGGPLNMCWGADLNSYTGPNYEAGDLAFGVGGMWEVDGIGAYVMPMVGVDGSLTFFGRGLGGAFLRLGPAYVALESIFPLTAATGMTWNLKGGFVFGGDDQPEPTAAPTPSANAPVDTPPAPTTQPAVQPAAPAAAATGAVAGVLPYTLDDVVAMIGNDVTTARILELTRRSCVSFRMNDDAHTRLRRAGADPELLVGLDTVCYSAP